jgi:hypothetical protein
MGRIESDIGSREFDSSGSGMRNFTVNDESQPQQPQMTAAEVMAARQRKVQEYGQVSDSAKRRIELLVGIGRSKVDVPVETDNGKTTYSLRTLKSREVKKVLHLATELSDNKTSQLEGVLILRERVLAYSLYAIDGVDVDIMLNIVGNEHERIAARAAFLEEQDDSFIGHIYEHYEKLTKNNTAKYSVKTEEEAKEVAEQMTKSGEGPRA